MRSTGRVGQDSARTVEAVEAGGWAGGPRASLLRAAAAYVGRVRGDFEALRRQQAKYRGEEIPRSAFPREVVTRIGLQMMVAIRTMQLLRDAGSPTGARVASRLIRHLYGAEVHWDARLDPGVSIIHGNGLVIGPTARIGPGCILSHNVTLAASVDPDDPATEGPTLERDVHVGPDVVLAGPITLGAASKVMAGAVLTRSVPERSLVTPAPPRVTARGGARPKPKPRPRPVLA